jgi:hypothetical protein
MLKKGRYKPINPDKYKGNPTRIIYRSGWEKQVMEKLDLSSKVEQWASEEIIIPYRSPIDKKIHRYFPDFWVKFTNKKIVIIEIKPYKETKPPIKRENSRKFIGEAKRYAKNKAKWKAAKTFCDFKGWHFLIQDEYDLGIRKKRKNGTK